MSKSEWTLHFHRTMQVGTNAVDAFVLQKSETRVTVLVPREATSGALMHHIVGKLNDVSPGMYMPKEELLEINAMFHGPWYSNERSGVRELHLSDDEARRIKHYLFKIGAEKTSLENSYELLREDFTKVVRRNDVLEQEVLLLHRRFGIHGQQPEQPRPITVADMLQPKDLQAPPQELPFEHASQVLCHRTGCGEV